MADALVERFRSAEAKSAYDLLVREAEAIGLRFHYPNSAVLSVELVERSGDKPLSAIANNKHLLFYRRRGFPVPGTCQAPRMNPTGDGRSVRRL